MRKLNKTPEIWSDVYKLPLHKAKYGSWVYDAESNFVFQFVTQFDEKGNYAEGWLELEAKILDCINGKSEPSNVKEFFYMPDEGYIYDKSTVKPVLLIRGWGNLTGTGGYNLDGDTAAMIQDTFAKFICDQLNGNPVTPITDTLTSKE